MCRLYGFRANQRTKVECSLVHAQNALLIQSRSDEIGRAHPDGWGIAYFEEGRPHVEKRATAAYQCLHFSNTAERVYSTTVLSHVRLATIGTADLLNSHPFQWGNWVFAHNGTVTGIALLRDELMSELSDTRRCLIQGSTDSELLFHYLMEKATRAGAIEARGCSSLDRLTATVAEGIAELDGRCQIAEPGKQAKLNVVLTDGRVMIASRYRNTLRWIHRDGIRDCEVCGIPHVKRIPGTKYHAVVIASEPLSHESWETIPDGTVVSVDDGIATRMVRIADLSSAES